MMLIILLKYLDFGVLPIYYNICLSPNQRNQVLSLNVKKNSKFLFKFVQPMKIVHEGYWNQSNVILSLYKTIFQNNDIILNRFFPSVFQS